MTVMLCIVLCATLSAALRAPAPPVVRRSAALGAAAVAAPPEILPPLEWSPAGCAQADGTVVSRTWTFRASEAVAGAPESIEVSYVEVGAPDAPPALLIHGFGASAFHFRNNVNALAAAGYRVLAVDLVGFGATQKPRTDYGVDLWVAQCAGLLDDVAGGRPAVVAGNSIGGNVALALGALRPDLVRGVASLNGAGTFAAAAAAAAEAEAAAAAAPAARRALQKALDAAASAVKRLVVAASFVVTKQPARIQQVLRQVYPVSPDRCDAALVDSIEYPARDADAADVFYRIVTRAGAAADRTVEALLAKLEAPLLLCWGEQDPWCTAAVGDRFEAAAAAAGVRVDRASIEAGHCVHDEAPDATNAALLAWMSGLA